MVKFKRMYDEYVPDYEQVYGDYLVDDQGYEPLMDLLKRCIRDNLPVPERSPGLVEDIEADKDLVYDDRIDQALFPEDYQSVQAVQPVSDWQNNINETKEVAQPSEAEASD